MFVASLFIKLPSAKFVLNTKKTTSNASSKQPYRSGIIIDDAIEL